MTGESAVSLGTREGNITGKISKYLKPRDYMPNGNSPSGEAEQMSASITSKQGLAREERAALPSIRTGPECPKGNLRELT